MNTLQLNAAGGSNTSVSAGELASLQNLIRGRVITAGNGEYETARKVWNGLIDRNPGVIVQCLESHLRKSAGSRSRFVAAGTMWPGLVWLKAAF